MLKLNSKTFFQLPAIFYLNTSYVKVKQKSPAIPSANSGNLNTSYVKVKPNVELQGNIKMRI
mgnify:CR=1 FL=1